MAVDPLGPDAENAIDDALEAWLRDALFLAGKVTKDSFRVGWRAAFRDLALRTPSNLDPQALRLMENYHLGRIRNISQDTRSKLKVRLLDALRDGLGQDDAMRLLAKDFAASRHRLRMIARTELNRSANWARLNGYIASGVVAEKRFVATHDDRVRADHLAADGDIVPVRETFSAGAAAGFMSPPVGPNCRCTLAPVTGLFDNARFTEAVLDGIAGLRGEEARYEKEAMTLWGAAWERLADLFGSSVSLPKE